MELKELTERTMSLFCVTDISQLGEALLNACSDKDKLRAFRDLVSNDLTVDWLQKIYQYYLADRAEKKARLYASFYSGINRDACRRFV